MHDKTTRLNAAESGWYKAYNFGSFTGFGWGKVTNVMKRPPNQCSKNHTTNQKRPAELYFIRRYSGFQAAVCGHPLEIIIIIIITIIIIIIIIIIPYGRINS